jgi:hypothetical protein
MLSDQRHERARTAVFGLYAVFSSNHTNQVLRFLIGSDRDDHSAADLELFDERIRDLRPAGGN